MVDLKKCWYCGRQIAQNSTFCDLCGMRQYYQMYYLQPQTALQGTNRDVQSANNNATPDAAADKSAKKKLILVTVAAAVISLVVGYFAGYAKLIDFSAITSGFGSIVGSEEDEEARVLVEICKILDNKQVINGFTPTVGSIIPVMFHSYDITYEQYKEEEGVYLVTISGSYSPTPSSPAISMNGRIVYKVDINKRVCSVYADPDGINGFITGYAAQMI